jgi:VIT1/CCC1 family predicted Fe2+/Mn2+ transporter
MQSDLARWQANLADELNGATLYEAIAAAEKDPQRADIYRRLAQAEREHAAVWQSKLLAAGAPLPTFRPHWRTRVLAWAARRFGPAFILPSVAAAEFADRNKYADQADAVALGMSSAEHGHAAILGNVTKQERGLTGGDIAGHERWHRGASGNDLRAAVLGATDGLVSNFCLVMGVAGAGVGSQAILLTGVAGLVAGACSMALGEWLSVLNSRELAQTQLQREAQELQETPEVEQKELALIYESKGLSRAEAERVAARLMEQPDTALEALAREELGIDPNDLGGNPLRAAVVSFVLFAVGAAVPVLPFFWLSGSSGLWASMLLAALALFVLGAGTSLFNGRSTVYSGLRQLLVAAAAAALTFGVGKLFGVALA